MRTSTMQSVPFSQRFRIRRSPRSRVSTGGVGGVVLGDFAGESVGVEVLFSVEPLGLINGSARTDEGLSAKAERVANS